MLGALSQAGHTLVEESQAEVLIVNTCSFIEDAQRESIRTILGARNPKIIVTGCLVQQYREELLESMPEIAAILGTSDFPRIPEVVERVIEGERVVLIGDGTYKEPDAQRLLTTVGPSTYLRIAEGCDCSCSFCVIPQLRGPYRSRSIESIVEEAQRLSESGIKEICLVAEDTTRYGMERYGKPMLPELIQKLSETDISWIRLHYAYPSMLNDELLRIFEIPKMLPYLDVPLQHSHPDVLKAMRRPVQPLDEFIARLRDKIPGLALRTTFVVGFPGETEEQFEHLLQFVQSQQMDHVGAFAYSPIENTDAAKMKQIPKRTRDARRRTLMAAQQEVSLKIHQSLIGKTLPMLIEGIDPTGKLVGRTYRDAPEIDGITVVKTKGDYEPGEIVNIKITGAKPYDLSGETV